MGAACQRISETPTVDNLLKINPIKDFNEIQNDLKFQLILYLAC